MINLRRSDVLAHFLALQRELLGRNSWETTLIDHPPQAEIDQFRVGFESWAPVIRTNLPDFLTRAPSVDALLGLVDDPRLIHGTERIAAALTAAAPPIEAAIRTAEARRSEASEELATLLSAGEWSVALDEALGTDPEDAAIDVYLVPYAPNPPAAGLISNGRDITAVYSDCKRFRGSVLADTVLALLAWARLRRRTGTAGSIPAELAERLPGTTPYLRRLRLLTIKTIVEVTAGFITQRLAPGHVPNHDSLATRWRFPRIFGAVERPWTRYLRGDLTRDEALGAIATSLSVTSPRWFVDHVDPAALAADFYLLELMSSQGHPTARQALARWLPVLASEIAEHVDNVIGNELGHYERVDSSYDDPQLSDFLRRINRGDSRTTWPRVRSELGADRALGLAEAAFSGPGVEFGGEAWAPVAATFRRYVRREIPQRIFVDQCFSLEHNNGALFDKYWDTDRMREILDAQACSDIDKLSEHASEYIRTFRRSGAASGDLLWSRLSLFHTRPGDLGCGSSSADSHLADDGRPVRTRHFVPRRPFPKLLNRYEAVEVIFHSDLGDIRARLRAKDRPYTVDNFVKLASGEGSWRDPQTGTERHDPYYDGTVFFRRLPGTLIQGGDRRGDGKGSAGYRVPEEIGPKDAFDRPLMLAMSNTGADGTGSQFFITLKPLPHLDGRYTIFGSVDQDSESVVLAVSQSVTPTILKTVTVRCS